MTIGDCTVYLGKRVSFLLPIHHIAHPYDIIYTLITGFVTAVIIDIDSRRTRFLLDDESQFFFQDVTFVQTLPNPVIDNADF